MMPHDVADIASFGAAKLHFWKPKPVMIEALKNFVKELHFTLDNFDTTRYNIRVVFRWCETRLDLHGGITQLVE